MKRVRCQASWRGMIMNIPLHLEVPKALALIVAQPDHRSANAGRLPFTTTPPSTSVVTTPADLMHGRVEVLRGQIRSRRITIHHVRTDCSPRRSHGSSTITARHIKPCPVNFHPSCLIGASRRCRTHNTALFQEATPRNGIMQPRKL